MLWHIEKTSSNTLNFALRSIGKQYFICNIFLSIIAINPVRTTLLYSLSCRYNDINLKNLTLCENSLFGYKSEILSKCNKHIVICQTLPRSLSLSRPITTKLNEIDRLCEGSMCKNIGLF